MITKRTDELRPGDRIRTLKGEERTIQMVEPTEVDPDWGALLVRYTPRPGIPGPWGAYANENEFWQVFEPSNLDLAVQRAQELADQYPVGGSFLISDQLKDFSDLLKLFRAAR